MASYNPGTYEGTGRGYGGKLIVNVTVSENKIESVKVTQHKEYRGIAWGLNTTPMERFPKLIVGIPVAEHPHGRRRGSDVRRHPRCDGGSAQSRRCVQGGHCRAQGRSRPGGAGYQDEVRTVDVVVCGAAQAAWPQPLRRSWPVRTTSSAACPKATTPC